MATMRRLKSSLKLGSKDSCNDFQKTTSLKRSNAKLRKTNNNSFIDIPEEPLDELPSPEILPPPKPFRRGHSLRPDAAYSSTSILLGPPPLFALPYDAVEPDVAPTFTRKDSQLSDESSHRRKSKSIPKLFSKRNSKRPQPPDNFTKWDDEERRTQRSLNAHGFDIGGSGVDSALASAILGMGGVAAGPSKPEMKRRSLESNPYSEAMRARHSWAAKRNEHDELGEELEQASSSRSQRKEKRQAICDIDWSQYSDGEAVRELISAYDTVPYVDDDDHSHNHDISPVDSGVGLGEDDEPRMGKGKGRATEAVREKAESLSRDLDEILATRLALQDDIFEQRKTWQEKLQDLQYRQDQELDRLRRQEEDRMAAEALAKQERLARERQGEQDRIRAEELEQAEQARLAAELLKPRECVCCGDDKEPSDFPAHPPSYSCEHSSQTCQDCMHAWIASEFTSKGTDDLKCPECPQTLSYHDIHRAATPSTFLAYERLLTRNLLGSIPDFSWCLNPAGCDSGQENSANNNYMECASCKYKQCVKHHCAWHSDETCEQYEYRTSGQKARDEEAKTAEMLDEVSKKCPGPGCGWRIQKIDGCDHMTCRKCRWEFCWMCLASHREIKRVGNTAHEEWCKFHSKNLETAWPFNMHA